MDYSLLLQQNMKNNFPNLEFNVNSKITSDATGRYNCIAWAANDNQKWWWPSDNIVNWWPSGLPKVVTIANFIAAFATLGYSECENGNLEDGFEKVVLYVDSSLIPTHMSRQVETGKWTSKLGLWHDISHDKPEDLSGPVYGSPHLFMKRKKRS